MKKLKLKKDVVARINKDEMTQLKGGNYGITIWPTDVCIPTFTPTCGNQLTCKSCKCIY